MTHQDAESIVAIATLAALADGRRDPSEHQELVDAADRLGLPSADTAVQQAAAGQLDVLQLAARLSSPDARLAAYETAVAVCHADGAINPPEGAFLRRLAAMLGIDDITAANAEQAARAVGTLADGDSAGGSASTGSSASRPVLDDHILDQAMLAAALELLPDRLANLAILPLQLRLVRHVGQQHGQQLDAAQIRDLAAVFGIGAAAQVMERMVRRTLGGLAGGLLGGLAGSAAGIAAGGAVTFAATYALGHAANQYYAQGRTLSNADLKALFTRFQGEAGSVYPRVQHRITDLTRGNGLDALMRAARG